MGIDLYYLPGSSPCRAILLAAKALDIELNLKLTELSKGDHLKPEFVKMNPQHTIPFADDDGFYMNESRAIIRYFANTSEKGDSLYPKDPKQRYLVDKLMDFDMGTLYHRFAEAYYPVIFLNGKLDADKVGKLDEALGYLEGFLEQNQYAAGDHLTIADFCIIASLSTFEACGHDMARYGKITSYMSKLKEEIEGYAELNQQGADQFGEFAKSILEKASASE